MQVEERLKARLGAAGLPSWCCYCNADIILHRTHLASTSRHTGTLALYRSVRVNHLGHPPTWQPGTHPQTHARTRSLQANLTCLPACLPVHPDDESDSARYAVRECHVCKPAIHPSIQPVPQRQSLLHPWRRRRLFALCRSARSRASPRLNVHCSRLLRPATRLVSFSGEPSPPPLDPQVL